LTLEKNTGIKRVLFAARYSYAGLKHCILKEAAFRQEFILALILLPLAVWLDVSKIERILMIVSLFLVMIVELLNTAIEAAIDRIGTERHELSGLAKDVGSAAVLLSLLTCGIIWAGILFF